MPGAQRPERKYRCTAQRQASTLALPLDGPPTPGASPCPVKSGLPSGFTSHNFTGSLSRRTSKSNTDPGPASYRTGSKSSHPAAVDARFDVAGTAGS